MTKKQIEAIAKAIALALSTSSSKALPSGRVKVTKVTKRIKKATKWLPRAEYVKLHPERYTAAGVRRVKVTKVTKSVKKATKWLPKAEYMKLHPERYGKAVAKPSLTPGMTALLKALATLG